MAVDRQEAEFWSTREAAGKLGVSLRTVQLWAEAGVLKAWKTAGGHRRITRHSVEQLLRQRALALRPRPVDGRFRILVVEDDPDARALYELHMTGWDLPTELDTAANGFEALLKIGASRPDLLITDLRMPGIDGVQMIRALRSSDSTRDLDIIVVTALASADIAGTGGLPRDLDVLGKPLSFEDLHRRVVGRISARSQQHG